MGGLGKEGESTDDSVLWNRSAVYPKIFGKNYGICYKITRKPNFSFEYYDRREWEISFWLSITGWWQLRKFWKCPFIHLALKLQVENAVFKCSSKVKEAGQKTFVLPYDLPPRAYTKSGMYTLKSATDYLNR